MGKRKRGIGCKESENSCFCSVSGEDALQGVECKKQCLNDISEGSEFCHSNATANSPILEPNENAIDEIHTAVASDTPPILQLRSSARVQNKRKEEIRCETSNESLLKKDTCSQDEDEEEAGAKQEPTDGEVKKRQRAWEVWLMEDKDIFFEAIKDCGKDFEAIQNYLTTKLRRKGNSNYVPKNKNQVRHFYYRTCHKISKYVTFHSVVKKATQELYALINYGELRRKVGGTLNLKKGQKLRELILYGSASFRIKGRSIRIRTPLCRALKRLNELPDHSCYQVPSNITLYLSAGNIESWSQVQSVAHNPRVRIKCPLDKQLSSIFSLLEHKWRSQEVKMCERLASSMAFPVDVPTVNNSILRLRPELDADIKIVDIQAETQINSSSLSLVSHENYLKDNTLKLSAVTHRKRRQRKTLSDSHKDVENKLEIDVDSQDGGSDGELDCRNKSPQSQDDNMEINDNHSQSDCLPAPDVGSHSDIVFCDDHPSSSTNDDKIDPVSDVDNKDDPVSDTDIKDEHIYSPLADDVETLEPQSDNVIKQESDALWQLMALQNVINPHDTDDDVVFLAENTRLLAQIRDQEKSPAKENLPNVEEIKKGWLNATCGSIKIGELYLMFGKKKTLNLEYIFEATNAASKSETEASANEESKVEESENGAEANLSPSELEANPKLEDARKEFSDVLERLVTMVKSFNTKTTPGDCFFCGTSKPSATIKSPANSRGSSYGRSPGHSKSPRVQGSSKSPKSGVSNTKTGKDKAKPASAKRLLTCIPEEIVEKDENILPIDETPDIRPRPSEKPIQPEPVDATGGFRVPLAPAPRATTSNAGFNDQLSKLLPRYSRPRRTHRKNMFVQMQLPLLPSTSKRSEGFITLKILPQPGDGTSASATPMPPILPNQVIPMNTPVTSLNPILPNQVIILNTHVSGSTTDSNSPISMPIISSPIQQPLPTSSAISVNVSGQQLLTVQMPASTGKLPCPVAVPAQHTAQGHTIECNSFVPNIPVPMVSINNPVPMSAFNEPKSSVVGSDKTIEDFDVENVLSKESCYQRYPTLPPNTPLSQSTVLEDDKLDCELTCSTPGFPELKDISFLDLTPYNSPTKSKFSLSPLNVMSDSSNLSLRNTPKPFDGKMVYVSPIKLNLSSILNSVSFNRPDAAQEPVVSEPAIPEIHIPDTSDYMSSVDLSIGGKLSLTIQSNADSTNTASTYSNLDLKMSINNNRATVDSNKEKRNSPPKLMDITFANSNSSSSFSTLLAAVGHSTIETESCDTLQTPPRSAVKSQNVNSTKKDSNGPLGSSFKANLFASDCLNSLPTTTPSPPSSPSRLLQQSHNSQWLNNEVNDFSLSNFLSHLESPAKSSNSQKVQTRDDSCSLSSFLTDNSVDYVAAFAKFKAQIAKDNCNET